ncbi:MAG: hypothetical protein WCS69_06440 [Ignavibacteriaceae bacterium]|jgi:hypothetical protein
MEINEAELEKEIEEDLRTNPKYQAYFEQYEKTSIDRFVEYYKKEKASWFKYGELYLKIERDRVLKYIDIAEKKLWEIQQAKLFDLQCLWRAEQINIPEIKTSYDFDYWEKAIENCPFIPPITQEEFDLYREYIITENADLSVVPYQFTFFDWQDYDKYKRAVEDDEDEGEMPEWYLFYNNRRGGNPYLRLPDIRNEKEYYYRTLNHLYEEATTEPQQPSTEIDTRPSFDYYNDENLLDFVTRFEDAKIIEYAKCMHFSGEDEDDEELNDALETLKYAEEKIQLDSSNDEWRRAIITTANLYLKRKVYLALELAYKNYLRRLKVGIAFEIHESDKNIKWTRRMIEIVNKEILTGRKLNNEPEDFNF